MESNHELLVKWLKYLLIIHLVSLANFLISWLPINDFWYTWVQRGITAGAVFILLQLAPAEARYKKAAIHRTIFLVCLLVTDLVYYSLFIILAGSVFSLIAVYQEYNAHAEVIGDLDSGLCKSWRGLLGMSVLVSLASSVTSVVAALVLNQSGMINIISTACIRIPGLIIDLLYLLYLNKTIRLFQT